MKKQLVNDTKIWKIETSGTSYKVVYGGIGNTLRTNKKDFESEEKCKKEAEKAVKSKIKGGYTELTLHIPGVEPDTLFKVQQALHGNSKTLDLTENVFEKRDQRLLPLICKCTGLEELRISGFEDNIPKEIGNLTNLRILDIEGDYFQKVKIPDTIMELKNLEELSIRSANYSSISKIDQLSKLTILKLDGLPNIEGLPVSIGKLSQLKLLVFKSNRTETYGAPLPQAPIISKEIGDLTALESLDLSGNCLTALPTEIGKLKNLTELKLNVNHFDHFPLSICELDALETLELDYCKKITAIPKEFVNLTELEDFEIEIDNIKNIPKDIIGSSFFINISGIREFLSKEEKEEKIINIPEVPANKSELVSERLDKITEVFDEIKDDVYESEQTNVEVLQKFILGESDELPKAKRSNYRDHEPIITLLAPITDWNFIDCRILCFISQDAFYFEKQNRFIDGPSYRGYHEDFFSKWFIPQLEKEQPDQDLFSAILERLATVGINEQTSFSAFLSEMSSETSFNLSNETPNSVGRYLLARLEEDANSVFDQVITYGIRTPFISFMLKNDRALLDIHLSKLLCIGEYKGSGGAKRHIPFYLLEILCDFDFESYEHYIHDLLQQTDCHECIMECYRILIYHAKEKYQAETFIKVQETLKIISAEKKNDTSFKFSWSLGRRYFDCTPEFIDWALELFGLELKDTVFEYVKNVKVIDLNITRIAIQHFGQDAVDIVGEALNINPDSSRSEEHFRYLFKIISKIDYAKYHQKVWQLVKAKNESISKMASLELSRLYQNTTIINEALQLLKSKKDADRLIAVKALLCLEDKQKNIALGTLFSELLKTEKNDTIRGIVIELVYKEQNPSTVTILEMKNRIKDMQALGKLEKPVFTWTNKLPALYWADGSKFTKKEIDYIFYKQKCSNTIEPDIEALPLYLLVDKRKSQEFATVVWYKIQKNKGLVAKNRPAFAAIGLFGGADILKVLGEEGLKKRSDAACELLGLMSSYDAALVLDKIMKKYRDRYSVAATAEEALITIADHLDLTFLELQERMIPDFDFSGRELQIHEGRATYTMLIDVNLQFKFRNDTGKIIQTIPKASADFKKVIKEKTKILNDVAKQFAQSMEMHLVTQRHWPAADWKVFFMENPVAFAFSQSSVWVKNDTQESFIVLEDGSFADVYSNTILLKDTDKIMLAHPLLLGVDLTKSWLAYFNTKNITSTFKQLERTIEKLTEDHKETTLSKIFTEKHQQVSIFRYRVMKKGWKRGSVTDGGGVTSYKKTFSADNIDAFIDTNHLPVRESYQENMDSGAFYFVVKDAVQTGSYVYDNPASATDKRLIPFKDVPPIVYSEALADIRFIMEPDE
ncbi:DUF4132 domain-containing protein [Aquimarina spinulae]|uniref:DUF4132 domain-containing protein n=1 Tax=Aquimarina spinulae TaxID=1192023 RepID=UPI000D55CA91|nr:DUF4132 domain-containing protein [Aquimarina spinulae]